MAPGSHLQLACIFMSCYGLHLYGSCEDSAFNGSVSPSSISTRRSPSGGCIKLYDDKTNFFTACDICEKEGSEILSLKHLIKQSFNLLDYIKEYGSIWTDQLESFCQNETGQCEAAALIETEATFVDTSCSLDFIFLCYRNDSNCTDYPLTVSTTTTTAVYTTSTLNTTTREHSSDKTINFLIPVVVVVVVLLVAIVIATGYFILRSCIKPTIHFARKYRDVGDHRDYELPRWRKD